MSVSSVIRPNRILQMAAAMVAMILISLYEYTFTLFEKPLGKYYHWNEPTVAAVFTVYMVIESFAMIFGGRLADRFGPRWVVTAGGILAGLGWILAAHVSSPTGLYIIYGIGSVGPGFVYAASIGSVVKWFPNIGRRRGLAVGFVTGAFGAGSSLFIPMLAKIIHKTPAGFQHAFTNFGIIQLIGIVLIAQLMGYPSELGPSEEKTTSTERQFMPKTMLRTLQFWILWVIFVLVVGAGQMTVAHLASIGADFKFATAVVVGIIMVSRVFNGIGRIIIGGVSDLIGRERSMAIFFALMAVCLYGSTLAGHHVALFGILSVATLFFWGPIFTLVPATLADYFGAKNASYNYGVMSTGKALGGLYAGFLSGLLFAAFGSWVPVLDISAVMVLGASLLALFLRSPQRGMNATANSESVSSA